MILYIHLKLTLRFAVKLKSLSAAALAVYYKLHLNKVYSNHALLLFYNNFMNKQSN